MSVGRALKPRRSMPSAIAPEDTSTTSLPRVRRDAIWAAQRAIAALSRPRPSLVTSEEPTLTMMREADWMTEVADMSEFMIRGVAKRAFLAGEAAAAPGRAALRFR